jgi:hypothetical protein
LRSDSLENKSIRNNLAGGAKDGVVKINYESSGEGRQNKISNTDQVLSKRRDNIDFKPTTMFNLG